MEHILTYSKRWGNEQAHILPALPIALDCFTHSNMEKEMTQERYTLVCGQCKKERLALKGGPAESVRMDTPAVGNFCLKCLPESTRQRYDLAITDYCKRKTRSR